MNRFLLVLSITVGVFIGCSGGDTKDLKDSVPQSPDGTWVYTGTDCSDPTPEPKFWLKLTGSNIAYCGKSSSGYKTREGIFAPGTGEQAAFYLIRWTTNPPNGKFQYPVQRWGLLSLYSENNVLFGCFQRQQTQAPSECKFR